MVISDINLVEIEINVLTHRNKLPRPNSKRRRWPMICDRWSFSMRASASLLLTIKKNLCVLFVQCVKVKPKCGIVAHACFPRATKLASEALLCQT